MMKLYSFFRSSAAYRVRIALNLKGLTFDTVPVHLRRGGGEQFKPEYRSLNPQALVPLLADGGNVLAQSLAIIEYLEEVHPQPRLLPASPAARARVRALALAVACDIHPLDNLRVLKYLTEVLKIGEDALRTWYNHWITLGLQAMEAQLASDRARGKFCHGDAPGLADCCLVPQLANARRYDCDLAPFPTLLAVEKNCVALDAFKRAAPAQQPDAE